MLNETKNEVLGKSVLRKSLSYRGIDSVLQMEHIGADNKNSVVLPGIYEVGYINNTQKTFLTENIVIDKTVKYNTMKSVMTIQNIKKEPLKNFKKIIFSLNFIF